MVISQPPGNNPSYYYRVTNAASIALNASRDTLCSIHAIKQHQVTHRNGAIKYIFYTNQIHGGLPQQIVLYSFCRSMRLPSSEVIKYYFKSSVWGFINGYSYIHLSVAFPSRMPAGPHFVTQPILLSENIPNIWHKSSTKHKEEKSWLKR